MLDAGAAPPIDRLIVVADDERHAVVVAGKQSQPRVLDRVGVLELVDQQVSKAAAVMRQQFRIVSPQFVCAQQ